MFLKLNLGIDFYFTQESINKNIKEVSIGNFALGKIIRNIYTGEQYFSPYFIGRSDTDLRTEISKYLYKSPDYQCFKIRYYIDATEAYKQDCITYHYLKNKHYKIDNQNHPIRPQNSTICCPTCGVQ